jgi:DNA-binding NarL/FixJ family response regulator
MSKKLKVLIADDHSIVRMGLTTLLEMEPDLEVAGQAANGTLAVSESIRLKPVVVLDLMMPELDGASATAAIKAELPRTKIVLFTTFPASDMIAKALENGAEGVIFKSAADTELIKAIRKVANGEKYISSDVAKLLASDPPIPPLSPRQRDILESMARGLSNAEIARQFNITPTVVREYSISLFQKIGAANRTEAVAIALRKHLLKI